MNSSAFDDPRGQQSDELSFFAEKALARGDRAEAEALFTKAAKLETELALSISRDEPRVHNVLAISAVALWLKARNLVECEKLALHLLGSVLLTVQGRADVRALLERCWREMDAAALSKEEMNLVPLEMKLDGGRIRRGLAPSAIVRDRQQTLSAMLVRTTEWKMERPFRKRGEAKKEVLERAGIYEAPAIAASYGVRLFVASSPQMSLLPDLNAEKVVTAFLELAALAQTTALEAVDDDSYRSAFLAGFRDLAPDGGAVDVVTYSTPASYLRAPSSVFGASDRERLSEALIQDHAEETFEVRGTLKVISLKGQFISIEPGGDDEESIRLSLDAGKFDDTIGPKLNRRVLVLAETRKGRQRDPKPYVLDVLTIDEDGGGKLPEPSSD